MKKLFIIALALVMLLALTGCCLSHEWAEADCVNPKICTKCEETEGEPLGHTWAAATCVTPKTCEDCGETEGEALGHTLSEATCTEAPVCSVCGETEGEALGHTWVDATYEAPKTCSVCGETEGEPLEMIRYDLGMDYETFVSTMNIALNTLGYELEFYEIDADGMPTYFVTQNGTELEVVVAFELMENGKTAYSVTVATPSVTDTTLTTVTGIVGGVAMAVADNTITQEVINELASSTPIESGGSNVYMIEYNGLLITLVEGSDALGFYICPLG